MFGSEGGRGLRRVSGVGGVRGVGLSWVECEK